MSPTKIFRTPPRTALIGATGLVVPVLVVSIVVGYLGGWSAGLGVAIGALAALAAALTAVGVRVQLIVVALVPIAAAAGWLAHEDPWLAGLATAVFGVAQAPLNRRSAGVGTMLPVVVAISASLPPAPLQPRGLELGVMLGAAAICLTAAGLKIATPAEPIPVKTAWRHAVAVACTAGATTAGVVAVGLRHGYWMTLVLALVLRPTLKETAEQARGRVIGTAVGLALALALVSVSPRPVGVALAAAFAFLSVAYALTGDLVRQTLFGMPALVLLASSGLASGAVDVAVERLGFTLGAIILAGLTALLLRHLDGADEVSRVQT